MNVKSETLPADIEQHLKRVVASAGYRPVTFSARTWEKWFGKLGGVSVNFEAFRGDHTHSELTRGEMVALVDSSLKRGREGVADAFVVTMLWGYGPSGYGAYRTHEIFTQGAASLSSDVLDRLHASVEPIRSGADDAFWFMNNYKTRDGGTGGKVRSLGPAFFTKWMYAVSAQGNPGSSEALPILDAVMRRAVAPMWDRPGGPRMGYTADYVEYVDALKEWGRKLSASAVEVEEAVFDVNQGYTTLERLAPRPLDHVFG